MLLFRTKTRLKLESCKLTRHDDGVSLYYSGDLCYSLKNEKAVKTFVEFMRSFAGFSSRPAGITINGASLEPAFMLRLKPSPLAYASITCYPERNAVEISAVIDMIGGKPVPVFIRDLSVQKKLKEYGVEFDTGK